MKHFSEEELIGYHDGEKKDREVIEAHLKDCAACKASSDRVEAVFAAMDSIPVPEPGEDYGRRVWQSIATRLPEKRSRWWMGIFEVRRLAAAAAITALVILAFLAGILLRPKPRVVQPNGATDEALVRERVLWLAVGEHLGKTEMMLMELANTQPRVVNARQVDISSEQRRAEDLLEENRLYRQTALQQKDTSLVSTLDVLDRVLMDVAHSPDAVTPAQLEKIQQRISEQGILLKIRVVRQQLREKRNAAAGTQTQSKSMSTERKTA